MVIYNCPTYNKEFKKKSHIITHTENKKKPCKPLIQTNPILIQNNQNLIQNNPNLNANIEENLDEKQDHICDYCGKSFYNGANLNKHLRYNCKVKKEDDANKENIFKLLLEKEELLKLERAEKEKLNNKVDDLQKQLIELTKTIKDLSNKTINNINKGVINNITITSEHLSKFGKEDLSKISDQEFLKIRSCHGIGIFKECAKLIYNNKTVNRTVYVADYSRKKAMIWDGKDWILSDIDEVVDIMKEKIRYFYNLKLGNLEDELILKDFETRIQKYFDMLYDEYDEKKEDNKIFMERAKGLQDKFERDLIKWLFNIKKDVMDNYNNILKNLFNDQSLIEQKKLIDI